LLGSITLITSQTFTYYASFDPTKATKAERDLLVTNQLFSARINQIAFGALAAVTITGIIQAQVAFVPEIVTIRKRQIPQRPTTMLQVLPTVGLTKDTFSFGVMGTF
jgi:hypothetical protein